MKTALSSFLVTLLFIVSGMGVLQAKNSEDIFRNEIMDEATNKQTVTLCKNYNGLLTPLKMYTIQYNEEKVPVEKVMYKYSGLDSGWVPTQKYTYSYDESGQMKYLSLMNWDNTTQSWKEQDTSVI